MMVTVYFHSCKVTRASGRVHIVCVYKYSLPSVAGLLQISPQGFINF